MSLTYGVSGDSSTVVGVSHSAFGTEAFRWTSDSGTAGLGSLSGRGFGSESRSVSSDGTIIVGKSGSASGLETFRLTSGISMVGARQFVGLAL